MHYRRGLIDESTGAESALKSEGATAEARQDPSAKIAGRTARVAAGLLTTCTTGLLAVLVSHAKQYHGSILIDGICICAIGGFRPAMT